MWRKRYCCLLLTAYLLGIGIGGCDKQKGRMAWRFEPRGSYSQRVSLTTRLHILFPDMINDKAEMVLHYQVREVDPEGMATIEVTIGSIKASMKSMTIRCSYDSEKTDQQQPAETTIPTPTGKQAMRQKKYNMSLAGLKGSKYHARVDTRGRVLELFDIDPTIKKAMAGPVINKDFGGCQKALLLCKTNLRDYVGIAMLDGLDDELPDPNHSWTSCGPVQVFRSAPVMASKTYTLKDVENRNGHPVATVSFKTSSAMDNALPEYARATGTKRFDMEILRIRGGRGEVTFRLDQGRLLRYHEIITAEMGLSNRKNPEKKKKKRGKRTFCIMEKTVEFIE